MILQWLGFCLIFCLVIFVLAGMPLVRHRGLSRQKKWFLGGFLFLLLVPGGLALYLWVGVPALTVL